MVYGALCETNSIEIQSPNCANIWTKAIEERLRLQKKVTKKYQEKYSKFDELNFIASVGSPVIFFSHFCKTFHTAMDLYRTESLKEPSQIKS